MNLAPTPRAPPSNRPKISPSNEISLTVEKKPEKKKINYQKPQKYVVKKPDELKIINEQKQLTAQNDFLKKFSTLTLDCIKKEYEDELRDIQKDAKYDDFKGHMKQNRTHKVRCMDVGRVVLTVNVPPQIDYIHANTVKLPKCPKEFICTQAPRENTQGDFWRMVSQFETKKIFYFNCPNDIDYIDDFFPKESGAYANYGDVFVSNKRAWKDTTLQLEMHNLEVLPDGCSNSIIVQLVIIEDWPDGGLPEEERLVLRAALLASDGMNVVLDRCGADRPGIFISACLAMERFKIDFVIDVKEAVKNVRNQRLMAVSTYVHYGWVYWLVATFFAPGKTDNQNLVVVKNELDELKKKLKANAPEKKF